LGKALWWPDVDRVREMHDHPDKEHDAVVRKGFDGDFLKEKIEASGGHVSVNLYPDISAWLEGDMG
jgi:hypothetical protein